MTHPRANAFRLPLLSLSLALLTPLATAAAADSPAQPAASATPAPAAESTLRYAPSPAWVLPPPPASTKPAAADAPARLLISDSQVHVDATGTSTYRHTAIEILKSEALGAGNLGTSWNPAAAEVIIHQVRILRGGQVIDVLKEHKFDVHRHEDQPDLALLTGTVSAQLQVPGLQVGDRLDVAWTEVNHDPTIGPRAFGWQKLPDQGQPGVFRVVLDWPQKTPLHYQFSPDLARPPLRSTLDRVAFTVTLTDPDGVVYHLGAPARYNLRRLIEYTDYADWAAVSRQFAGLFDAAVVLAPDSPVRAAAARIAATTPPDPQARAIAALRLVQDTIRYVYVGLDGGNYRPATADETWTRRFGDCKAKTVLLLALLRELKVPAQAVLVSLKGDDGLDERLASPGAFNHVLVRAFVAGRPLWLDGTRSGDHRADTIPPMPFRWGLPLVSGGTGLEKIAPQGYSRPQLVVLNDIDASAGVDGPATAHVVHVLRGDGAASIHARFAGLAPEDLTKTLRGYFAKVENWIDADTVTWHWDEPTASVMLEARGPAHLNWITTTAEPMLDVPNALFPPPDRMHRPPQQDATLPWQINYPNYMCFASTIHLSDRGPGKGWLFYSSPQFQMVGGVLYYRAVSQTGRLVQMIASRKSIVPEISAAEAERTNNAIQGFASARARIIGLGASTPPALLASTQHNGTPPFNPANDWLTNDAPCNAVPQVMMAPPVPAPVPASTSTSSGGRPLAPPPVPAPPPPVMVRPVAPSTISVPYPPPPPPPPPQGYRPGYITPPPAPPPPPAASSTSAAPPPQIGA